MAFTGYLHLLYSGGCRGVTPPANCSSEGKICMGTGLSYDTNEPVLKDAFGQHGEIIEVKVICDHKSGKSKGYGFVHFVSEDSASKALAEMDDQLLDGRNIRIQYANKKRAPECQINDQEESDN
ncbi:glycine-rich RNA-binding protein 2, mitochondrial isoform X2 [Cynara cardunculus var. scolymus]|uniref:glycine-rich RNA-binding protein 2, mitochondrial isoform X2 n=1 Tax=Cynara cardunculus var. scolymus TaxID=59895 RepID=UPI000D62BD04|nr:glycine-rich RNA-binding protein 2, mitochondrial isoform X2 [Cynara cardunculus var. scolymus]